jgi:hypothetical protein
VLSVDVLILSFRTMFDSHAAAGLETSIELRLGEDRFHTKIAGGRMELHRGSAGQPAAVIEAGPGALAALVERFLGLFPLHEKAPVSLPRG